MKIPFPESSHEAFAARPLGVEIEVPQYSPHSGLPFVWHHLDDEDSIIDVRPNHDAVEISANRAGLISLARYLLSLASEGTPPCYHGHFHQEMGLEKGSMHLILQRINSAEDLIPQPVDAQRLARIREGAERWRLGIADDESDKGGEGAAG